jgi:TolB-like protein/predicted Ser/Thr protein kinase
MTSSSLTPGQQLGRYRILEQIGAGGMGIVYRAHDDKLDRNVALKALPLGVLADEGTRNRFRDEALTLSKLSHPNIATIHDFDSHEGIDFLVMEYVTGLSLSERLASGPLPEKEIVALGEQIAKALEDAHEIGIIHRDLKPRNVMVTPKGQVKLLDFGLAKLLMPSDPIEVTKSLTRVEAVAGTLPYIAPEQLRGEAADFRTDVYALGCVLYEMATGGPPLKEKSSALLISAILNQQPPRPVSVNRSISPALESLILKALEKEPERRYQAVRELRVDLSRLSSPAAATAYSQAGRRKLLHWRAPAVGLLTACLLAGGYIAARRFWHAPPSGRVTLAVLPFHILTGEQDIGFLRVGIADAITAKLASVGQMRLRPTSATLRYEKEENDPRAAGQVLASDYVVTGTVQKSADNFRVTAQLVRVSDGSSIWGEHYDVARADLLGLEDTIAEKIASGLKLKISSAERQRLYRRYTQNPAAYELYLRGRADVVRYTKESTRTAVEDFESALRLDPNYALAHAGLAMASAIMRIRFASEAEYKAWEERAHQEAQRAIELDNELAEAHEALAAVYRHAEFDWDRVLVESGRALELNSNLDMPHFYRAAAFYHLGLMDEVETEVRAGEEVNPANRVEPLRVRGSTEFLSGRFENAERHLTELRDLSPGPVSDWYLAQAMYHVGDHGGAEAMLANLHGSAQAERRAQATLASFLAARGEKHRARVLLSDVVNGGYMDHHVAYSLGAAYVQVADPIEARRWLASAINTGFPCYPWFERDPMLDPLRNDPEFQHLMAELRSRWDSAKSHYGAHATR